MGVASAYSESFVLLAETTSIGPWKEERVRTLIIEATSKASARRLASALSAFDVTVSESTKGASLVTVAIGGDDRVMVDVLNAIEEHVTARASGPARIEIEGRSYTMHARRERHRAAHEHAAEVHERAASLHEQSVALHEEHAREMADDPAKLARSERLVETEREAAARERAAAERARKKAKQP